MRTTPTATAPMTLEQALARLQQLRNLPGITAEQIEKAEAHVRAKYGGPAT